MAKKKSKIVRLQLDSEPYETALFCPYCGAEILEAGGEGIGECPHLIYADLGEDPEEEGEQEFLPNDLCFVFFEPAPASREHYFVFRESGGGVPDKDEEPDG